MDKSTVHIYARWGVFAFVLLVYLVRVFTIQAFYIITYGLGIYLLNLFIGFLSPQVRACCIAQFKAKRHEQIDPENEGPVLPSGGSEEFRPFSRRVPEFKFWYVDEP